MLEEYLRIKLKHVNEAIQQHNDAVIIGLLMVEKQAIEEFLDRYGA